MFLSFKLCTTSDCAIAWLLKFLATLLGFFGQYSPILQRTAEAFPSSVYQRDKFLGTRNNLMIKYVVCTSCHALYHYNNDRIYKSGSQTLSKKRQEINNSKVCNNLLLKTVISKSGSSKLYPYKVYCYSSLISTL